MTKERKTVSRRLAEGPIPPSEPLGLAVQLGDALRHTQDEGRIQGVLNPDVVNPTGFDLELLPAESGATDGLTPYAAPELLDGHAADVRADVFAFGAVVYEILTGRPAPTGVAGFDRLTSGCLSNDGAGRSQLIQHVMTETRLAVTNRRAGRGSVPHPNQIEQALRTEMELLESRLVSRLDQCEGAIADLRRDLAEELAMQQAEVSESFLGLRNRMDETEPQLEAALKRCAVAEQAAERAFREMAVLREAVSAELDVLTDKIATQSAAIEMGRAGMVRTDDVVERVVEALEVIQGMVIEQAEKRSAFAGS